MSPNYFGVYVAKERFEALIPCNFCPSQTMAKMSELMLFRYRFHRGESDGSGGCINGVAAFGEHPKTCLSKSAVVTCTQRLPLGQAFVARCTEWGES